MLKAIIENNRSLNKFLGEFREAFQNKALTTQAIIAAYLVRWEVENFYRATRFILGWSDYQMRDLTAIENHVLLGD
jgi:hypothetical protein